MASSTDIANIALAFLRSNLQIGNLATDQSIQARLFRTIYPLKRDEYLTYTAWSFCKTTANLAQLGTNPTPVWAFSYAYPADCLFPRRILGVTANVVGTLSFQLPSNALVEIGNLFSPQTDTAQDAVRFEVAEGKIYTNMPNAIMEYTQSGVPEGNWPPKFIWAMAYGLAAVAAPSLTDGDPFGLGQKTQAQADKTLKEAAAEDLNRRMQIQREAEVIRQRGGW